MKDKSNIYYKIRICVEKVLKYYNLDFKSEYITNISSLQNVESEVFLPNDINKYIENTTPINAKKVKIDQNIFEVFSYDEDNIDDVFFLMIFYYYLISIFCNNIQTIHAKIFLTPFKKQFYSFPLTPKNINTGYTIYNSEIFKSIVIFRKEEWSKVWIHELLHAFNLTDWHLNDRFCVSCVENYYSKKFANMKSKMPAYILESEAYTEFITQIIYYAVRCKTYVEFQLLINKSIIYTEQQLVSLLYYSKCNTLNNLSNNNYSCKWTEETSSFGYYYLRFILMKFYNESITQPYNHISAKKLHKKIKLLLSKQYKLNYSIDILPIGFSLKMITNF